MTDFAVEEPIEREAELLKTLPAYYRTQLGAACLTDSLTALRALPSGSINLVVTSPPYALHFKKAYGNVDKEGYVEWLLPFGREIHRVLAENGSFVLNIGGSYNRGTPTRSLYHYKLLVSRPYSPASGFSWQVASG